MAQITCTRTLAGQVKPARISEGDSTAAAREGLIESEEYKQ